MKKFIKNIIIYSCFLFFIMLALQILIVLRAKGNITSDNNNLEQTSHINADLVLLGSSRCTMHFDPHFFNEAFNLKSVNIGIAGHSDINMAIVRLKCYLLKNKSPKFAILNFDPFSYAGDVNYHNNIAHKDEFARYAFFPSNDDILIVDYFKFNLLEKYFPLYSVFKYRQFRDCVILKKTNDFKKYGYQMNDKSWDTIANPITTTRKADYFRKYQIASITNSLKELKKLCAENNIKLLCIQTPVYKAIYDKDAFSLTKKMCENAKISFIDVNTLSIINNIDNFFNVFHLNKNGISKMNQFLEKDKTLVSFLKS